MFGRVLEYSRRWRRPTGFNHILNEPSNPRDGMRMLVLAPTRELANQIFVVAKQYAPLVGLSAACVYGGVPIHGQVRANPMAGSTRLLDCGLTASPPHRCAPEARTARAPARARNVLFS